MVNLGNDDILMIRHAHSNANRFCHAGMLLPGQQNFHLTAKGHEQAEQLGEELRIRLGRNMGKMAVATSEFWRTQETARVAGFSTINPHSELNEIMNSSPWEAANHKFLRHDFQLARDLAVHNLLVNQPEENIWFSHGFLMSDLMRALGRKRKHILIANTEIIELSRDELVKITD